ncbi:transcriptional regulator PpsR [Blastomonas sp.]|uniref:transcriptional regulator PpsR n=1 Tax=Blastomonas sp. TaxID=1909299 RepID=UPI003594506F
MPFRDFKGVVGKLEISAALGLVLAAGDIALALDEHGVISDISISAEGMPDISGWIGRYWVDTVAIDSKPKVAEMLASHAASHAMAQPDRWRQVNHPGPEGNLPIHYRVVDLGEGQPRMAIGRDVRSLAALQQRLLQTQQSLERDYLKLRQTEARFRLLFDMLDDPLLIIDATSRRVVEANPASYKLFKAKPGSLPNRDLANLLDPDGRDALIAHLGATNATGESAGIMVSPSDSDYQIAMNAIPFRQDNSRMFIIRFVARDRSGTPPEVVSPMQDIIEHMPDAFVLTDAKMAIITANAAFVDLVHGVSQDSVIGQPLGTFIGRPGIDLELMRKQIDQHGQMRNATTIVHADDAIEEAIEVSGVRTESHGGHYGFAIRTVSRRVRDLPAAQRDTPRSVDQLTELVGRMPLKEIVRESTDLIERMCIEAALSYTSDNRASAAEILGLSRQSLYSKLHRHGLGNLIGRKDELDG